MTWVKEITINDLPDEFRGLAEIVGLDCTMKTIVYFEGSEKYFPKVESAFRHVRDRMIRKKWRKHNIREIAQEFNLSHNQIREIVKDHEAQIDLIPRQEP